jgi:hypothetical protein
VAVAEAYKEEKFDGISFCIPTGGDTPELRACVARILALPIKKEVVLCGKMPRTFPYINDVRVVGEDIPYPPVWITRKKNLAVQEARFSIVAVLHDRVLLPLNFADILSTGLPLPVMGIGGIFSLSRDFNLIGRYSDFNVRNQNLNQPKFSYLSETVPGEIGEFSRDSSLMMARGANFHYYTNHKDHSGDKYATGSFYLTRKSVHTRHPLNEELFWEDFEDVEWGMRCKRQGIPHVFNSDYYQLTLAVRPMILPPHPYLDSSGAAYLLSPPWADDMRKGTIRPDAAYLITAERFVSNFKRFITRSRLDDRLAVIFDEAYFERDADRMIELAVDAVRLATQGVKTYDETLISNVEGLMSSTLERTNLGDMRCHAQYFNEGFDLWGRISTNYGFTRWLAFLKIPGLLRFTTQDAIPEKIEVSDAAIYQSCMNNLTYLNTIFGHNESPQYWFNVVKSINWSN